MFFEVLHVYGYSVLRDQAGGDGYSSVQHNQREEFLFRQAADEMMAYSSLQRFHVLTRNSLKGKGF